MDAKFALTPPVANIFPAIDWPKNSSILSRFFLPDLHSHSLAR